MRSVVLYLVLVGTPLLGLLGILEAGERIVPPRSVSGEWQLLPTPVHEAPSPCLQWASGDEPGHLSVSQSGTRAEVVLRTRPRLRFRGEVRGDSLIGTARHPGVSACPGGRLRIGAELRDGDGADLLHGIISVDACAACSPSLFVAHRLVDEEEP